MSEGKAKLSEKIGYGFGDMSSSMFWKIFSYYLPFFYSNIFGLSLAHAGTLLLVTKLYDAITDPLMGIISDRTHTRWGSYRPYLLWCAAPFAIAGILTFTTPDAGYTAKHIFAYVSYLLMMTVYTAINVPYGAMLGVVVRDPKQKTVFSSFRMFFAYAGSFIALALFEPLLKCFERFGVEESWQYSVASIGLVCAVLFLFCFLMTKERIKVERKSEGDSSTILRDLKALMGNGPWWIVLAVAMGFLLFNSIRGGVAAYYFKDYLGTNALVSCGIFLSIGEVANMVGVALAVPVAARLGKKMSCFWSLMTTAVLSFFVVFLPADGTGMTILIVLQVLICIASGLVLPLTWSMFADISDYSAYTNGSSSTGLIFSSSSMAQKFGGAFGSALILWLLAAFGYDTSEAVVQGETAICGLKSMMSWIPAIGSLLAAVAISFYPLTDNKMKDIAKALSGKDTSN